MRLALTLALALAPLTASAALPPLNKLATEKLEKGDVIIRAFAPADDNGFAATAFAVIDATPDTVWATIRDCSKYAEFMPRAVKSEIRQGTPDDGVCFMEIGLPFPFSNLWAETRSKSEKLAEGGYRRTWELKEGTYEKNKGSWTVYPWGEGGQRTLLMYSIEAAPDTVLPDRIIRSAQNDTLPDVFKAVRKRVKGG